MGFTGDAYPEIRVALQLGMLTPLMEAIVSGLTASKSQAKALALQESASQHLRSVMPEDLGNLRRWRIAELRSFGRWAGKITHSGLVFFFEAD